MECATVASVRSPISMAFFKRFVASDISFPQSYVLQSHFSLILPSAFLRSKFSQIRLVKFSLILLLLVFSPPFHPRPPFLSVFFSPLSKFYSLHGHAVPNSAALYQ